MTVKDVRVRGLPKVMSKDLAVTVSLRRRVSVVSRVPTPVARTSLLATVLTQKGDPKANLFSPMYGLVRSSVTLGRSPRTRWIRLNGRPVRDREQSPLVSEIRLPPWRVRSDLTTFFRTGHTKPVCYETVVCE